MRSLQSEGSQSLAATIKSSHGDFWSGVAGFGRQVVGAAVVLIAFVSGASCGALATASDRWLAAEQHNAARLQAAWTGSLDVRWQGVPLRDAIERLAEAAETSILLDRRIDPYTPIELTGHGTVAELVGRLAAGNAPRGVSSLGGVLYLGPTEAARELRTLHALSMRSVAHAPRDARSRLQSVRPLQWTRLARPQSILDGVVSGAGLRLEENLQLPHDLWPAGKLPRMSLAEQLTLLLVGFERKWRVGPGGATVIVEPIERPVELVAWHEAPATTSATREGFLELTPGAKLQVDGHRWTLRGLVEEHLLLENYLIGRTPVLPGDSDAESTLPAGLSSKRLTLTVREQPVGAILTQLAKSLELDFDPAALRSDLLGRRVSLRVEEVNVAELLSEIGDQARVKISLTGRRIGVSVEDDGR